MKTRPSRKTCGGLRGRDIMNAQTPAGSRAADTFLPCSTSDVDGTPTCIAANGSTWDNTVADTEGMTCDGSWKVLSPYEYQRRPRSLSLLERDIPEELVHVLKAQVDGMDRSQEDASPEELADAFQHATTQPPITKQSLGELDIGMIIHNSKLRHDVNFDRDLSFRPNNEGSKGQQKNHDAQKYWLALRAELHLYSRLFSGTPPLRHAEPSVYFKHAQKRIPMLFKTIHDILKSLVPDRDHSRVDEHLDVGMLMQQIERGVCDMVALVEWTAHLLKEHCAPMRDVWVDEMVQHMRIGASQQNLQEIVLSLSRLLALLETMKLDVANHQIRNLKPLLIEDTIKFETHYHLEKIVNQRAKVNVYAAQQWWANIGLGLQTHTASTPRDVPRIDTFSQAVISSLFSRDRRQELPDTFYLDFDRLRCLKLEIEDLVHFEMCFAMFNQLRKGLGHSGTLSDADKNHLRSSLVAILGESIGHGSPAWMYNSESISLEIYRQAHVVSGRAPILNHNVLRVWNERLRTTFQLSFGSQAATLETVIIQQVLTCVKKNFNASPAELYNNLVATPPPTSTPSFIQLASAFDTFSYFNNTPQEKLNDLSKRISHIVLLHWRIWAPIAYVQNDQSTTTQLPSPPRSSTYSPPLSAPTAHTTPAPPPAPACPAPAPEHEVHVLNEIKMGEPPDSGSGYESNMSEETRLP